MLISGRSLKLVVLDYPVFLLEEPFPSQLFAAIIDLKIKSYGHTYGDVMPFDKSDFFGTHFAICEEDENGELTPIATYRSVSLDRCEKYFFEFPAFSLLKSDSTPEAYERALEIVKTNQAQSNFTYDSAWASNLNHRLSSDKDFKGILLEITMMIGARHHMEGDCRFMFTCGVKKVKTDKFFERLGLLKLHPDSEFKQTNLSSEEVVMFVNNEFSLEAHAMVKKYKKLWDERIVFDGLLLNKSKVRIAS